MLDLVIFKIDIYVSLIMTVILLYSFYFSEKKYFNKFVISVINVVIVSFRGLYMKRKNKTEDN